jgi:hypothetical protein
MATSVATGGASNGSDSGSLGGSRGGSGGSRGDSGSIDGSVPDAGVEATVDSGSSEGAAPDCDGDVSTVSPAPGALDVPTSAEVSASFGCPLDTAALELTLTGSRGGGPLKGTIGRAPSPSSITFTPSRALALATPYVAELRRGGTLLRSWSFTTRDGTWQDPETVTKGAFPHDALGHDFVFAINGDGAGIVAYESAGATVSARRFDVGSGLSPDTETVVDRAPDSTQELAVGIDANRRATVAWMEYGLSQQPPQTGQYFVNATSADAGGAWGPVHTAFGPRGDSLVDLLQIGVTPSGAPLALWTDTRSGMALADLSDGSAQPFSVSGAPAATGSLIEAPSGATWVIWKAAFLGGTGPIGVGRFSVLGTWDRSDTLAASSAGGAALAASADGSAIAVFQGANGSTLVARRFTEDAGWSDPLELDTQGDAGTTSAYAANVAADPEGNAIALFTTTAGSGTELRSQRFTPSDGWASAHETLDVGATSERALGLDDAGRGFALGVLPNGEVRTARWLPESGWQPSLSIGLVQEQSPPTLPAHPLLEVLADGRAVALWRNESSLVIRRFRD